ncbi:hypothetical protein QL285_069482 [Trifolium repens]|nr:hypothetical protein QL285_069482 [Trifolium repens]
MSQKAVEELRKGQELLKKEINGLKTQMSLVIQILLRGEGNPLLCPPHARLTPQTPLPWVIPPHQKLPRQQAPPPVHKQNRSQRKPHFDPIPMSYADLLLALIGKNLVQTRAPPHVPAPLPIWFKSDHFCAFHQGAPGHDIEDCWALKYEVQKLTRANVLSFKDPNSNV